MDNQLTPLALDTAPDAAINPEARLLRQALRGRLPLPEAYILPQAWLQRALANGAVKQDADGKYAIAFADDFVAQLQLPASLQLLQVCALDVPITEGVHAGMLSRSDAAGLAEAMCRAWHHQFVVAQNNHALPRQDLLFTKFVEWKAAGVAVLQSGYAHDAITVLDVENNLKQPLDLQRLRKGEKPFKHLTPWQQRLQILLAGVRRVLGDGDWTLRWGDDGTRCVLLQIAVGATAAWTVSRKLDAYVPILQDALPAQPSMLTLHLLAAACNATNVPGRWLHSRADRPAVRISAEGLEVNTTLLHDALYLQQLPQAWLPEPLQQTNMETKQVRIGMGRFVTEPLGKLWRAPLHTAATVAHFERICAGATPTATEVVPALQDAYNRLVQAQLELYCAATMCAQLSQRLGGGKTEPASVTGTNDLPADVLHDLQVGQALVRNKAAIREALEQEQLPTDAVFKEWWIRFFQKHGHRARFELDIAAPRLRDAPKAVFDLLLKDALPDAANPTRNITAGLRWPLAAYVRLLHRHQARVQAAAMVATEKLRHALLAHAAQWVRQHQLGAVEAVCALTPAQLQALAETKTTRTTEVSLLLNGNGRD
jgi:hypothetical protein